MAEGAAVTAAAVVDGRAVADDPAITEGAAVMEGPATTGVGPGSAPRSASGRATVRLPPASARPARVARGERPVIPLAKLPAPDQPSSVDTGYPQPLVLVGEPRLRSEPRGLPGVANPLPDIALDGADLPTLAVRAGSVRGDDHRYLGETRQDSFGIWSCPAPASSGVDSVLIACVADGVGGEPLSHLGSALACRLLREAVPGYLPALLAPQARGDLPGICAGLARDVARRLHAQAEALRVPAREISTTMVAAVLTGGATARHAVLFGVGDSSAYLLGPGGWRRCLGADDSTEAVTTTATRALPTQLGVVGTASVELGVGEMLLLCTDGLGNPMRDPTVRGQLARWWGGGQVPTLPEFLWQLSFRAQSYGDDRTAVCAWGR